MPLASRRGRAGRDGSCATARRSLRGTGGPTRPAQARVVTRSGPSGSARSAPVVEQALRHPGRLRGHRRLETCDNVERTQHVVGSNGGCRLPYDRRHYRTVRRPAVAGADVDRRGSGSVTSRDERGPHVDLPPPRRRDPLHDDGLGRQQARRRLRAGRPGSTPGSSMRHAARVDPVGQRGALGHRGGEHVEAVGQRRVQRGGQARRGRAGGSARSPGTRPRSPPRWARHRSRTAAGAG